MKTIQLKPGPSDEDIAFHSDLSYLKDLADDVMLHLYTQGCPQLARAWLAAGA